MASDRERKKKSLRAGQIRNIWDLAYRNQNPDYDNPRKLPYYLL